MTKDNMEERVESVKAAVLGGLSTAVVQALTSTILVESHFVNAFFATTPINNLLLAQYFSILDYRSLISLGIAGFSGFLFGVTYRYIIRTDNNLQLKAGGVMAFGLIRGLSQLEMGFSLTNDILPFVLLAAESILHFGLAAIVLDIAIQRGWVKPFKSN